MYKTLGSSYEDQESSNTPSRMCTKAEGMESRRRVPVRMKIHDHAVLRRLGLSHPSKDDSRE